MQTRLCFAAFLAALALNALPLRGQRPSFVHDFNTKSGSANPSIFPDRFFEIDDFQAGHPIYFVASMPGARFGNRELWVMKAPYEDARPVKDIRPGIESSSPVAFSELSGQLVFVANDGVTGRELWITDGSEANTRRLTDLRSGKDDGVKPETAALRGQVFFSGFAGTTFELFVTDGNTAKPLLPLSRKDRVRDPKGFTVVGSHVYFHGFTTDRDGKGIGQRLWISDGTPFGTVYLEPKDTQLTNFAELTAVAGKLYFSALVHVKSQAFGTELCVSDGTDAGTKLAADVSPGPGGSSPRDMVLVESFARGDRVLFTAAGANAGARDVYALEPTGVQRVTNLPARRTVRSLVSVGEVGLWIEGDLSGVDFIRRYHAFGTSRVEAPVPVSGFGNIIVVFQSGVFLAVDCGPNAGAEFFRFNSNLTRIDPATNLVPGDASPTIRDTIAVGGDRLGIVFAGDDGCSGVQPWYFPIGGEPRPVIGKPVRKLDGYPAFLQSVTGGREDQIVLRANDGANRDTAHVATRGKVVRLTQPDQPGAEPGPFTEFRGKIVFPAAGSRAERRLFQSGGTAATTKLVNNPVGITEPSGLTVIGGRLLMNALVPGKGFELVELSNGELILVADIHPRGSSNPRLARQDIADSSPFPTIVLAAQDESRGNELHKFDDSTESTRVSMLRDIRPGAESSNPEQLVQAGTRVFFTADDGNHGRELWVTDGTTGGTRLVKDIFAGADGSFPTELTPVESGGRVLLFFVANDGSTGDELWVSDGTAAGTRLLRDIETGTRGSRPSLLTPAGGAVFFRARTTTHGHEPWITDGTASGTRLVKDVRLGARSSLVLGVSMTSIGTSRRILFGAIGDGFGVEVWTSDGTAAGTMRITNQALGRQSFHPNGFHRAGDTIFFSGRDARGFELWAYSVRELEGAIADGYGEGCLGAGGTLRASAAEPPLLGNGTFAIRVMHGRPSAPAITLIGVAATDVPLGGGCRLLVTPLFQLLGATDTSGSAKAPLPIPNDRGVLGTRLFAQVSVIDPVGGFRGLASFSNGVRILVGR